MVGKQIYIIFCAFLSIWNNLLDTNLYTYILKIVKPSKDNYY